MKHTRIIASALLMLMALNVAARNNSNQSAENKQNTIKMEELKLTSEWDKTFPKSDKVNHSKVTFPNRYGVTLAADLYVPKDAKTPLPAIAVCGPFGAVKEQAAGLYAQEMAERGFITLAFDPSFTGESGGAPRYMTSPDINTEDFSAAVDYLVTNPMVNPEEVGIIGICGWGGIAINAAASDPRIKATVASTMYDMSRVSSNGYFDSEDSEEARNELRKNLAAQRTEDFRTGTPKLAGGVPDVLPDDAPKFLKDYHDYYKTERGYHPRSLNSNGGRNVTSAIPWVNFPLMSRAGEIENAVMIIHGEKAHSFYFGSDAYKKLTVTPGKENNKLFMVIPGASHTDLYDQKDIIPFDAMVKYFNEYLK
ncbi:MAG: alpha/beta hydrolase [Muribaculaceae bacterium]|nr:alpha/beta hydrolase [Muribaculaceae bacterium]